MRLGYRIVGLAGSTATALALAGGALLAGAAPASADVFNCSGRNVVGSQGHEGIAVTCEGNTPHERFRAVGNCIGDNGGYPYEVYGNWVSAGHTSTAWCPWGDGSSVWWDIESA